MGDLGVFVVGRQRRQVQLVVHPQHAGASSLGHGVHTSTHARQQRRQELRRLERQRQPRVVSLGLGLPALGRDEQALPASEGQAVLDPHRTVAHRSAQGKQRGRFQRPERPFPVRTGDRGVPHGAQAWCGG